MKSKENIVFLGMMGSGKTSLGFLISKKLKLEFFDIDKIIEEKLGMKITKIFNLKGESFFREIEEKITLEILEKKKGVIALGGGAFLNKLIRKEILINHHSFWLKCNNQVLLNRIRKGTNRPLATKTENNELLELMKKRSIFYSKADHKINCDNLSKIQIINRIIKIYKDEKSIS